jgi:cytochrome c biogenesis protein CcdA
VPGAFLIGFVVSLFLLPCTSGPHIVILGLLAKTSTRAGAIPLLLLYNFIFVLPMLIITMAIAKGMTTTKKAEEWRQGKLRVLHLIAGIIILGLGLVMLGSVFLGHV